MVFFILGSHPELSTAEIKSVLPLCHPEPACPSKHLRSGAKGSRVLMISEIDDNLSQLQERLAGTVKIGHVLAEVSAYDEAEIANLIATYANESIGKNKISFGISVYDNGDQKRTRELSRERDHLGKEIKKLLKETGRSIRFVSAKEPELSSVIVTQNGLLESGGEYCFFAQENRIVIGQTQAVQDFKQWSARDYGRPARDKKSGMLPPKLARMMVNLAGDVRGKTVFDPFCGSGTILMEAQLLGADALIGSDVSEKAVRDTEINLSWLVDKFKLKEPEMNLHTVDARSVNTILDTQVDFLVTETFLGKPRRQPIDDNEVKKTTRELMELYESSFSTLRALIKQDGTAVVAFPAFVRTDRSMYHLPLKQLFERLGYTVVNQFTYHRTGQFVARDIFRLNLTSIKHQP